MLTLLLLACHSPSPPRVIVLGFDGLDPDDVAAWRADLPAFSAAIDQGLLVPLDTTTPPQSPVAWSSFATSHNPGQHGIFDFIRRDPKAMFPEIATNTYAPPRYGPDGAELEPARVTNLRDGATFWRLAAEAKVPVRVLTVPYDYPPEPLPGGQELAGLGAPDIRLTNSSFTVFEGDSDRELAGGKRARLTPVEGGLQGVLEGPVGPHGGPVGLALDFIPAEDGYDFTLHGERRALRPGSATGLQDLHFPVGPGKTVDAWADFALLRAGPAIYVSALMPNPLRPYVPVAWPESYGADLALRYGRFRSIGWVHDTSALQAGLIGEDFFLSQLRATFEDELRMTLGELDRGDFRLFLKVFTEPDRVAHMFTRFVDQNHPAYDAALAARYADAIHETYRMADRAVREVRARLGPNDVLIVLSDHGFQSSRRGVDINRALVEAGLMTLREGQSTASNLNKKAIDWEKTRAYALGTGQVYLNLRGREATGIVPPEQAAELLMAVRAALLALRDPQDGAAPLVAVYTAGELWSGPRVDERAPDLQLAFAPGYQVARRTTLGGVGEETFEANLRAWSGDHAASDAAQTQGVFWMSSGAVERPNILDVAPTVLDILGVPIPADFEGRSLRR